MLNEELFNKVIAANPAACEISSFINSLLVGGYNDTPKKYSWRIFMWKCMQIAYKAPTLLMEFYKNFTVPQEVLEAYAKVQNGEDRIRTCGTHTSSRI